MWARGGAVRCGGRRWAGALLGPKRRLETVPPRVTHVVYEGSLTYVVKVLKGTSLTTAGLGLVALPVLAKLSTKKIPVMGKIALSGVVGSVTLISTVLLQWISRPYIHRMTVTVPDEASRDAARVVVASKVASNDVVFDVEQLSLFMFPVHTSFTLAEVQPTPMAMHPFQSFEVDGRGYYVEGAQFPDKELLVKLYGRALKDSEKVVASAPAS